MRSTAAVEAVAELVSFGNEQGYGSGSPQARLEFHGRVMPDPPVQAQIRSVGSNIDGGWNEWPCARSTCQSRQPELQRCLYGFSHGREGNLDLVHKVVAEPLLRRVLDADHARLGLVVRGQSRLSGLHEHS